MDHFYGVFELGNPHMLYQLTDLFIKEKQLNYLKFKTRLKGSGIHVTMTYNFSLKYCKSLNMTPFLRAGDWHVSHSFPQQSFLIHINPN